MSRIACLLVPDLPVAALCRADPELVHRPLVVAEGDGPHARITAAAALARARGVCPGVHSVAQARAIAADLIVRSRDPAVEASAARALADVAGSLASRLEHAPTNAGDGAVFLDVAGTTHLTGSEHGLASALVARAARVGLDARAGIGASKTVARLAALHGDGCEVVAAGSELGFLAPLPLACLTPPPDVAATLGRWGVLRLGDLARLPAAEVSTRLGAAGAALVRAARGEDERPLAPSPPAADVEEGVTLEWPLETIEPLLFVLRGLVERAVARLGLDGIGCTRLGLALGLDDRSRDVRALDLVAPTRDQKTLLICLRVALEARPPRAAVVAAAITAVPERVRATQLGLFVPPGPAPERLATTLARLGALCGPGRVGVPVVVDTHRPGAAVVTPFALPPAGLPAPTGSQPPCRLVVRVLRPPRLLEVFSERDAPCFVRGTGLGGRVVAVAGPWRIAAEWWTDAPCARDYFDLELTDGGLYRCYRERASGAWFVDGVYD
jgi:protein ImuB